MQKQGSDDYGRKVEEAVEQHQRIENEMFTALGGTEKDLEDIGGFESGDEKASEDEDTTVDKPVADNESSVENEVTVATDRLSSAPQEQLSEGASSPQDPPARRQMTPLELAIRVNNILMAFPRDR